MPATLVAGQNTVVSGRFRVNITHGGQTDVDVCALLLGPAGTVRAEEDFVFFNAPAHPSGAVHLAGGDAVEVDLGSVPGDVDRVLIVASVDTGQLGDLPDLLVTAQGSDGVLRFSPTQLHEVSAATMVEAYRRGAAWKLRALGQGWASGLEGLATEYGITVDDTPPAAAEPAPEAAQVVQPAPGPGAAPTPDRAQQWRADWYRDPQNPTVLRWWSGHTWSGQAITEGPDTPEMCRRCGSKRRKRMWGGTPRACRTCENTTARDLAVWSGGAERTLSEFGPRSPQFAELWTQLRYRRIAESNGLHTLGGLAQGYLENVVAVAFADDLIEDHEVTDFEADVAALPAIDSSVVEGLRARLHRGHHLGLMRNGDLPAVATTLHLEATEVVHLDCAATHVRFLVAGPKKTYGRLVVSSTKMRFLAATAGSELALTKVVNVVPRHGHIEVHATTARGGGVYELGDVEWSEAVLTGATRVAKRLTIIAGARDTRRIPQSVKAQVYKRDQGRCVECGATEYLEFDHVIPYSLGGATSVDNLQLLCRACNLTKGARI